MSGYPANGEIPALTRKVPPVSEPEKEHKSKKGDTRYRGRIAKSEQTRDGHSEVLVDHSTEDRWGKPVGKVGKRAPGDPPEGRRSRA